MQKITINNKSFDLPKPVYNHIKRLEFEVEDEQSETALWKYMFDQAIKETMPKNENSVISVIFEHIVEKNKDVLQQLFTDYQDYSKFFYKMQNDKILRIPPEKVINIDIMESEYDNQNQQ